MLNASAAERNKQPILDVLQNYLNPNGPAKVLEIASGTGQHIVHFAYHHPHIIWQPSDIDQTHLKSISAYITFKQLGNVLPPMLMDISKPIDTSGENLKKETIDLILNSNMVHISAFDTSVGLFKAAGILLKSQGVLFMYGPFKVNGKLVPESNVRFDAGLRAQDPSWGVRDVSDLEKLAKDNGLKLENMVEMPANNKCLIFRKLDSS